MNRIARIGMAMVLLVLVSGCLHSNVDENWGKSQEAQVVWQTENPEAPENRDPTDGLDPETGKRVADRYYESQEKQPHRKHPSVALDDLD